MQVTVHKESEFATVLQLTMTVADAIAVLGAVQSVIHEALNGQYPRPTAPVRVGPGSAA
ncbi:hypothetical protein [Nocardia carnea]|uniref:hypothetical protein n=1 Tax=Nocardia carnea TaxID=37328 RepID=UPI002453DA13|nr:hypothetical protein [Nocardia carnea]